MSDLDLGPAALTGPCPCEGCRHAPRCRSQRLACEAFSMYVVSEPERRWQLAPRAPTAARYQAILEGKRRPARAAKAGRAAEGGVSLSSLVAWGP